MSVTTGVKKRGGPSGARHPFWKGGRFIASNGYVLVHVGKDHHLAGRRVYAYEHRIVAEEKIGRRLESGEQVHHLNEDKQDNRPENLEVYASAAHHCVRHRRAGVLLRHPGEPNPILSCKCGCGARLEKYDREGRPRQFVLGHNAGERNRKVSMAKRKDATLARI